MYDTTNIGMNLRRLREIAGFTQAGLASKLDVTRTWVSRVETGETGPSLQRVIQFALIFDVSPCALLTATTGTGS